MANLAAAAPAAPSEDEYQTFEAALSASARGRAFLAEYARRHRGADTETLLAALARLEALVRAQRAGAEPVRAEVRALVDAIRSARPEIAASALPARAAKLAQLLDLLERRLEAMIEPAAPPLAAAPLAAVPPPDEPELPIPSPAAVEPALTLAHDRGAQAQPAAPANDGSVAIPEVTWLDGPPETGEPVETQPAVEPVTPSTAEKVATLADPTRLPEPAATPADPLAPLMRLTARERLALFT